MSRKQIVRKHEREQLQKQSRLGRKKDKRRAAEPNKTNRDNLETNPGLTPLFTLHRAERTLRAQRCVSCAARCLGGHRRPM
jgi:hypothetical protein